MVSITSVKGVFLTKFFPQEDLRILRKKLEGVFIMSDWTDTIAAISTPPGPGAIGILRLSGPMALQAAERCFKPLGRKALREHAPRELVYGELLDRGGQPIDRVLCTYSRGPHSYTGEDAAAEFLPQVKRITAAFTGLNPEDAMEDMRLSCTSPARQTDYVPHAASITYVDYCLWNDGDYEAQLLLTVNMKNGDTIRLRQVHHFHATPTYTYTPEDAPMNTTEELQALLEELGRTAESDAEINIHLPPVAFEGELVLDRLAVNLYGSLDQAGARTTFTGLVHLAYSGVVVSFFEGIDFTGSGGTGVSASSRLHLTNCRLSGWDTAVFCSESAWVNTDQCIFSDNGVGLHINNAEPNISDSRFEGNTFQGNQTAVLLEQVGVETPLKFPSTLFSGNGTDIDNRCGQELDLDRTIFQ